MDAVDRAKVFLVDTTFQVDECTTAIMAFRCNCSCIACPGSWHTLVLWKSFLLNFMGGQRNKCTSSSNRFSKVGLEVTEGEMAFSNGNVHYIHIARSKLIATGHLTTTDHFTFGTRTGRLFGSRCRSNHRNRCK